LYESSLDDVRVPLEEIFAPLDIDFIRGDVNEINIAGGTIGFTDGARQRVLSYDRLVLAAGSRVHRPPIPGIEIVSGVDTYAEARALERHLSTLASREWTSGTLRSDDSRFRAVVVGAGFTGIEVATTLASRLASAALTAGARERSRVTIVERSPVVAPDLGASAREEVGRAFAMLGIDSRLNTSVKAVTPTGVALDNGEWLPAATTVWTGGFRASDLAGKLGVAADEKGRIPVDHYLRIRGVPHAFAAGDVARAVADDTGGEHIAPMSCQCAIPMGEIAGWNAASDLLGLPAKRFLHTDYVTCLDLGDAGALFMEGWSREIRLSGFWAKVMKQTINTRLIYPPRGVTTSEQRPAA
jgi:NADH dehydrogenase